MVLKEISLKHTKRNHFAKVVKELVKSTKNNKKIRYAYHDRGKRVIAFEFESEEMADELINRISAIASLYGYSSKIITENTD